MRIWLVVLFLCFSINLVGEDPLTVAAEYYFSKRDYRQALQLWNRVLKKEPKSISALLRVGELKFLFEGRGALRETIVKFLSENRHHLSKEDQAKIKEHLSKMQSKFLTDEGQSHFLQATAMIGRKDCQAALRLLDHAHGLERGNMKILIEKAKCEKALRSLHQFYLTLQEAYQNNPFDPLVLENLSEAHIYFGEYGKVVRLYHSDPDRLETQRQKIGLSISLMETGSEKKALPLMRKLVEQSKHKSLHPIIYFGLGKVLAQTPHYRNEATQYLKKFVTAANQEKNVLIEGWDPYRCKTRLDEAQKLLQHLSRTA